MGADLEPGLRLDRGLPLPHQPLEPMMWETFKNGREFNSFLNSAADYTNEQARTIRNIAELYEVEISSELVDSLRSGPFSKEQLEILRKLDGRTFMHKWEIKSALAELSDDFKYRAEDEDFNNHLDDFYSHLFNRLRI